MIIMGFPLLFIYIVDLHKTDDLRVAQPCTAIAAV